MPDDVIRPRIPVCTYRLQLNSALTFDQAYALVGYLQDLGISDVYASPFLMARSGSMHGYDVTDHERINPEIGSDEDFARFAGELRVRDMGLVMDVVPNHMCISDSSNRWWLDVLENGPSSAFASFFDVDWRPPKADLREKVLLPVLGDQYGRILENQEIRIAYDQGQFVACYWDKLFPLAPRTWSLILQPALSPLRARIGQNHPHVVELESILFSLAALPTRSETDRARLRERRREKEVARKRLETLCSESPEVKRAVDEVINELNGARGQPRSFDRLESLLAEQPYRLSFWRVAADEINYRRFFDINELAAIRVEEPQVFDAVHALALKLVRQGLVTGLRIDHIDGLHDPGKYLNDLQRSCRSALQQAAPASTPGNGVGTACYMVVEKILGPGEPLHSEWPVHGTTGYEFASFLEDLFVDPSAAPAFRALYDRVIGPGRSFSDVVYESKRTILKVSLSSELNVLARKLDRISEQHRYSRDFTYNSLYDALREVVACFPVYRSYVTDREANVTIDDRVRIVAAVRAAMRRNPAVSRSVYDFIRSVLLRDDPEGLEPAQIELRREFVYRFQQLTGPVMAKGVEDTAFYRHYPLASLNEVGGHPESFGSGIEEFHRRNQVRHQSWPHTLNATSTHDTKRGEDVRTRIDALSEMPEEWTHAFLRWAEWNRGFKTNIDGVDAPSSNEEYLFYQTLLGAWPHGELDEPAREEFVERVQRYMNKALKEAKVHTSWINPNEEYDAEVASFISRVLHPSNREFLADFDRLQRVVSQAGVLTSLSLVLLKCTCPGVPDLYQGCESWNLSLVDPDNRRPVDFTRLAASLASLQLDAETRRTSLIDELLAHPEDGRIKLYATSRTLGLRRRHPELYATGAYVPLRVEGPLHNHVIAFARMRDDSCAITVAARFFVSLLPASPVGASTWSGTRVLLPDSLPIVSARDWMTDRPVSTTPGESRYLELGEIFLHLPQALIVGSVHR